MKWSSFTFTVDSITVASLCVCVLIPTVYLFTGIFTQLSIILQTHTKLIPTHIKLKVIILGVFIFDITAKSYIHPHNYGNVATCFYVMLFPEAEISSINSYLYSPFCKYRYTVAYIKLSSLWCCTSTNSYGWVTAAIASVGGKSVS